MQALKHWIVVMGTLNEDQKRFFASEFQLGGRNCTTTELGTRLCEAAALCDTVTRVTKWRQGMAKGV